MTERELMEQLLQKVTNIDSKVTNMESELKTVQSDLKIVQSNVQTVQSELNIVKTDVAELKENQRQIQQAVLETHGATKRMETNQDKHERILDLLSRRSIEQEAEMKRIK